LASFCGTVIHVKQLTAEQVQAKKEKAVPFLRDVVGDDDKANQFDDMDFGACQN
jgi:hypothetical protein